METATLTRPGSAQTLTARPAPSGRPRRGRRGPGANPRAPRRQLHTPALCVLLLLTLVLRLWGIKQGLPYSYNVDEAEHFVPRAVSFFSQDLDPHYFLNPPAYSYLLHIVFELWFGSADAVTRAYTTNPTELFVVARVVAARARDALGVAHVSRRGAVLQPDGRRCSPRRSSASRSCRSSTATSRSTTCRRSPRSRCRCTGSPASCGAAGCATT